MQPFGMRQSRSSGLERLGDRPEAELWENTSENVTMNPRGQFSPI